jgi:acyl-CoA synthetase (AMP-forming)/AMP-acid ligase II
MLHAARGRFVIGPGHEAQTIEAGSLDARISALAGRIASGSDRPVGVLAPASAAGVLALGSAWRSGRPVVPLSPRLPEARLRAALDWAGADLFLVPDDNHATARHTPDAGWRPAARMSRISLLERAPGAGRAATPLSPGSLIQFTSGSTGSPQLAVRTREAVEQEIAAVTRRTAMSSADTVVCASSPSHSYGMVGGVLAPLVTGATIVVVPGLVDLLHVPHHGATIVFGLWPAYAECVTRPYAGEFDATRLLFTAGSPPPAGLGDAVLAWCGRPLRADYGTTETGTISLDTASPPAGAVGIPMPHLEVRVTNCRVHGGRDEIQVRPRATVGYLGPAGFSDALDEAGWFHTRDAGQIARDGMLTVGDRLRAPVRLRGRSLDPAAIEAAIEAIGGVREAVVYATSGRVTALVVAPELHESTIRAALVESGFPVPDVVELTPMLPRSPAGKILPRYE